MAGDLAIGRWIRDRGRTSGDRVAIRFGDEATTYAQLDERSGRLAAALHAAGVRRGDRVGSLTGNRPEHVELLFACARLGAALVPLNHRLAPAELAFQVDDATPTLAFVAPEHDTLWASTLAEARHQPAHRVLDRDGLDALAAEWRHAHDADVADADVADDDPLLVVYTSGTTGRPKGAVLTHANCFWTNLALDRTCDLASTDVVLQVLPQFHVGGWNVQPLLAWWKGATVVLEPDFDPARALDRIEEAGVTTMMGVPATYLFMADEPGFAERDLSSLRLAVVGGAPMPAAVLRTWTERGVSLVQGYGLTEAAPNVLCVPAEHAADRLGWAGLPYPHVDVALCDPDSGELLAGPATGELCVRGPNVFAGYWQDPAATRAAIVDGWLRTGDVAERDADGWYRIRDRVKDMFISGGENVYPAEVEAVLHDHPAVLEAAVTGVPHDRWGEVGVAWVVRRGAGAVEAAELLDLCRDRLARYKVPRDVRFVDALPRSAMNKVLKGELATRYRQEVS
jgi:fatty-acyl-CoA synthase